MRIENYAIATTALINNAATAIANTTRSLLLLLLAALLIAALFVGITLVLLWSRSRRYRLRCFVGGSNICHSIDPFKTT
jgi:hypothetical protein